MRPQNTPWFNSTSPADSLAGATNDTLRRSHLRFEPESGRDCQCFKATPKASRRSRAAMVLSVLLLLPPWPVAWSQSTSASYQIPRQTVDAGAGVASSATHSLTMSMGQPDAGAPMSSASYQLQGGFLRRSGNAPAVDRIFASGFEN